jgi:nucleotide-binding universal stress UspA family protein
MKILMAVDGSKQALKAVHSLIEHADWFKHKPEVELLTVHLPLPRLPRMRLVVGKRQLQRYYDEEGEACLAAARDRLQSAGIPCKSRILIGRPAETIAAHALRYGCDLICIGTHGRSAVGNFLLGSVASRLAQIARVPVMLVR